MNEKLTQLEVMIDALNSESLDDQKEALKNALREYENYENFKNTLSLLYEYGEKNLELIKNHTEEIKFATSVQQEIRKERSQFFSQTLKEVSVTLRDAQVDDKIASKWLIELVKCYTESLGQSASLVQDHTIDLVGAIRQEAETKIKMNASVESPDE
ncbi:nickel transporter [Desulfobacter latus]|uniref:Nickel transporter n=1 Tax=Desulfobacter latus TaxID=2292 RepID=A0A850T9W8_9BACT|nr:nickel transporter [Desulfobacter latus]NWH06105.1 nickel transporter [Desulfobacter latus]